MKILTIRTDKPDAEIGLYDDNQKLDYEVWLAHRQLSETIHLKIQALLDQNNVRPGDINGIVIYKGPGSFTGLRIGVSVANAMASTGKKIVGITGDESADWIKQGIERLLASDNDLLVVPEYGALPNITKPKH